MHDIRLANDLNACLLLVPEQGSQVLLTLDLDLDVVIPCSKGNTTSIHAQDAVAFADALPEVAPILDHPAIVQKCVAVHSVAFVGG